MASSVLRKTPLVATLCSLLISLSPTSSHANGADYQQAVKHYQSQQYQQAYTLLNRLVEHDYTALQPSFYLGLVASQLQKPQEAIAAFERVLIMNPQHTRSKLELGKLYYQLNNYSESRYFFEAALKDNLPTAVQNNVQTYLAKMSPNQPKHSLNGAIMIGLGHDSNSNNAPEASSWYVPVFDLEFENTTDTVASVFDQQMVLLNHTYNALQRDGYAINNRFLLLNKSVADNPSSDILYSRYSPGVFFRWGQNNVDFSAQIDHMIYNDQSYLNTYGLIPSISRTLSATQRVQGQVKWIHKRYQQQANRDRDAQQWQVNGQYTQLFPSGIMLNLKGALETERKESGDLTSVDYNRLNLATTVRKDLTDGWQLSGHLGLKKTQYQDRNPAFAKHREDLVYKAAMEVKKSLDESTSITGRLERLSNDSNLSPYDYEKNLVSVNMMVRF